MSKKIVFALALVMLFSMYFNIYPWEIYDRVIATVNEMPIVESEVAGKLDRLQALKKIPKKKRAFEKSRVLDKYIEDLLVSQTAARESIMVSDKKVDNHIDNLMKRMGIPSMEVFKKQIEKTEKMTFREYKEELKRTLMMQDVISIAIGVSPPLLVEAEKYYKKNRDKVGFEVNLQHIFLRLKKDTFAENKKVNKEIRSLYNRVKKGEKFATLAKKYSEDKDSKNKGGILGWVALSDLARDDMVFANNIYKEFVMSKGRMKIVLSGRGYHLVKYKGKRPTSFEAAKDQIYNFLYQQKQALQFKKWVYRRRLESDIKIYMKEYVKERGDL